MNKEELININGIREDLYQAMQIGDITLNSKHSQELYDFMNYQDKEIERLNNIIKELEKALKDNIDMCDGFIDTATNYLQELGARHNGKTYYQTILLENKIALKIYQKELDKIKELKGSDKE